MPTDQEIHELLQAFDPFVYKKLKDYGYFDIKKGEPVNLPPKFWQEIRTYSLNKNTQVADIVYELVHKPSLEEGFASVEAKLAERLFPSPIGQVVKDQLQKQYYDQHSLELVKGLTRTDVIRLRGYVWIYRGVHEKSFAKMLKGSYICDGNESRLKRIKRTESHNASVGGADLMARKANYFNVKGWQTARDDRVRPSHQAMQGIFVGIDEEFPNGQMIPTDPNCRCHLYYDYDPFYKPKL